MHIPTSLLKLLHSRGQQHICPALEWYELECRANAKWRVVERADRRGSCEQHRCLFGRLQLFGTRQVRRRLLPGYSRHVDRALGRHQLEHRICSSNFAGVSGLASVAVTGTSVAWAVGNASGQALVEQNLRGQVIVDQQVRSQVATADPASCGRSLPRSASRRRGEEMVVDLVPLAGAR
jgi:hypothetical protein